ARVCIAAFCARLDPTLEEINDIKTAVSEAVTNAIIHGYQKQGGIVHIEADIDGHTVTICISDDGCGIEDVNKAMEPLYTTGALEERSGMGFTFMEIFMDCLQVESKPGKGTKVIMKKEIGKNK
ncbi:MAG: anti-sigma F factor, partial [Lachnospiraceae bacterium]